MKKSLQHVTYILIIVVNVYVNCNKEKLEQMFGVLIIIFYLSKMFEMTTEKNSQFLRYENIIHIYCHKNLFVLRAISKTI